MVNVLASSLKLVAHIVIRIATYACPAAETISNNESDLTKINIAAIMKINKSEYWIENSFAKRNETIRESKPVQRRLDSNALISIFAMPVATAAQAVDNTKKASPPS